MIKKNVLYFPIKFFVFYLLITILIFAFGPWPWPSRDSWEVYSYMAFVLIAMFIGYSYGARTKHASFRGKLTAIKLYRIGLYLSLLLFIPTLMWRTGGGFSFNIELLLNPAEAYAKSHDSDNFSGTAVIEYIRIIVSMYLAMVLPLLIIFWEKLSRLDRRLGIFAIILEVLLWLAVGTNKGIGDLLIGMFWMIILKKNATFSFKNIINVFAIIAPLTILFSIFFTLGQIGRHDGYGVQTELHAIGISAERENLLIRYLPDVAQDGVIAFSSYIAQGYHGLALSLDEPFIFTWGVGHSRFLNIYVDKYGDTNIEEETYPARVEINTGWRSKVNWHTMFPWWASDITFFGVIILISVFSYYFALVWKEAIYSKNPYAISLTLQFATLFTFMPANNQIFQSGPGLFGFWLTFFMWRRTRI